MRRTLELTQRADTWKTVVVMKDSMSGKGMPIVVGVDGSPQSVLALKWAKKLAGPLNATIRAVSAWQVDVMYGTYVAYDGRSEAEDVLAQALAAAFGDERPDGLLATCRRGQSAQVLIEEAKSAQMLILGSRGHGGFAGMLLGSVSSACAAHATCPVLVVHGDEDPDADAAPAAAASEADAHEPAGTI